MLSPVCKKGNLIFKVSMRSRDAEDMLVIVWGVPGLRVMYNQMDKNMESRNWIGRAPVTYLRLAGNDGTDGNKA